MIDDDVLLTWSTQPYGRVTIGDDYLLFESHPITKTLYPTTEHIVVEVVSSEPVLRGQNPNQLYRYTTLSYLSLF